MLDFTRFPLVLNFLFFAVAATAVLLAGTRLSRYAGAISTITGIGHATLGIILLAGVTSLPEVGVTATASLSGDTALAINNLFGSIAMQVALLALVDIVSGRRALTAVMPDPKVILQGNMNVLLLALAACGMVVGDIAFFGVGLWSVACLGGYVACVWVLAFEAERKPWRPAGEGGPAREGHEEEVMATEEDDTPPPLPRLVVMTAVAAVVILVAGFVVARTGGAIATQTGLGSSFVGFVLVAISTSLPEASTALAAARSGYLTMAMSDVLGTNLINVALVFLVDVLSPGTPPLNTVDRFAVFGTLLTIVLTALFVVGLVERRDRAFLRMGYDSIAVLAVYSGGLVLLYMLR